MRVSRQLRAELARRGLRHLLPMLQALVDGAEGAGCRLSQAELAGELGCDVRTVHRHEQLLEQLGILRVVRAGRGNRRLVVIERLDAKLEPRGEASRYECMTHSYAPAAENTGAQPVARQLELFHTVSADSQQSAGQCGHACPVSSARQTGHAASTHIRLARVRARAEEPLSVSSARSPAAAPWSPWRSKAAVTAAASRGARMPEWEGPSRAVDALVIEWHARLTMFPNTLRQLAIFARDHCQRHGEAETLRYVASLARWCLFERKNPGGSFYARMKQWRLKIAGAAAPPQQHVLEDVGAARGMGGLLHQVLPREARHG